MILKRLVDGLRARDWFTVFVELLIVVAGIYLGLQANDWAQEREFRKQEQASLVRLLEESEAAIAVIDQEIEYAGWLNRLRREAVETVDSERPVPDDDLMLRTGINTLDRFPPLRPVTVAYDELLSAGQMQLIRSADLRAAIATYHVNLGYFNEIAGRFSRNADDFWRAYKRHVTWDYNPESETSDILLSSYDWITMRGDEEFIIEAIGKLRNQLLMENALSSLREDAIGMCRAIATTLGRDCQYQ